MLKGVGDDEDPNLVRDVGENGGFIQFLRAEEGFYVLEVRLAHPDGDWTSGVFVQAELPVGKWERSEHENLLGPDRVLAAFHDFANDPGRLPDLAGAKWRDIKEELWGSRDDRRIIGCCHVLSAPSEARSH